MKYRHTFLVRAQLEDVAGFHQQPESLVLLTPLPMKIRFDLAPEILSEGSIMSFTVWLGPLPVRWQALIENLSPAGFADRQLRGPFSLWVHRHDFRPVNQGITEVLDEVEARLRMHPVWVLVGSAMWVTLPVLFAYRAAKTREILEARRGQGS